MNFIFAENTRQMNIDKYVFSQLTSFLSRSLFNDYVRKYDGDKYVKSFTFWNQLLVLMFGQPSNREGFRDLIVASCARKVARAVNL